MIIEITDRQRRLILQALIDYEQDANHDLFRKEYFGEFKNIDIKRLKDFSNEIKEIRKMFDK